MSGIKHTILCVDDEKNIANALKRLLRKEGYRLLTASSGQEGLELRDIKEGMTSAMSSNSPHKIRGCLVSEKLYKIDFTPLSGMFSGRGIDFTMDIH